MTGAQLGQLIADRVPLRELRAPLGLDRIGEIRAGEQIDLLEPFPNLFPFVSLPVQGQGDFLQIRHRRRLWVCSWFASRASSFRSSVVQPLRSGFCAAPNPRPESRLTLRTQPQNVATALPITTTARRIPKVFWLSHAPQTVDTLYRYRVTLEGHRSLDGALRFLSQSLSVPSLSTS